MNQQDELDILKSKLLRNKWLVLIVLAGAAVIWIGDVFDGAKKIRTTWCTVMRCQTSRAPASSTENSNSASTLDTGDAARRTSGTTDQSVSPKTTIEVTDDGDATLIAKYGRAYDPRRMMANYAQAPWAALSEENVRPAYFAADDPCRSEDFPPSALMGWAKVIQEQHFVRIDVRIAIEGLTSPQKSNLETLEGANPVLFKRPSNGHCEIVSPASEDSLTTPDGNGMRWVLTLDQKDLHADNTYGLAIVSTSSRPLQGQPPTPAIIVPRAFYFGPQQ